MTEKLSIEQQTRIRDNLSRIRERIALAAQSAGRGERDVRLMAVSKTVPPEPINFAISCGVDLIGENRVQEFLAKKPELNLSGVTAHLIGHLQTNKVKSIVGQVDLIQSVDSLRLAQEIGKEAQKQGVAQQLLLEVNIAGERSKFGFAPQELPEAAAEIAEMGGVFVRGLMCVPPLDAEKAELRQYFTGMQRLFLDIEAKKLDNISMCILSMGMSGDFEEAVQCGSTLVRVGSAIFGDRHYQ